ncbi:MAG TPA: ABC transporter substrate-binding protein [Clostridia bacterium]|nr:ABC transporter substrate-binding protein [Clostridia bacterium]
MKKRWMILVLLLGVVMAITSCQPVPPPEGPDKTQTSGLPVEPVTFKLAGLKGPTSMGLASLVTDAKAGKETFNIEFDVVASPEEIVPKIVRGDCDLAAVPSNLAATLYNKTEGGIVVLAINTLGVLDIVERGDTIHSIADLAGKKIYASGQGAVPEYVMNLLLDRSGIDPDTGVELDWMSEHSAIVSQLATEPDSIALLPQPFVTIAQSKIPDLRLALDLNDDWSRLIQESGLVMGVLIARKEVVDGHPEAVDAFLRRYETSIKLTNESPQEASVMIENLDVFDAVISQKAIPFCNIYFSSGSSMKETLSGFLDLLFEINPQTVGGALPPDEFYYGAR